VDIQGKHVLILGGYGLVGRAVARALLPHRPARLVIASLRKFEAEEAVQQLKDEFPDSPTQILPAWGDVFLRAEWQREDILPRQAVLANPETRQRLLDDILGSLDEDILESSLLYQLITGTWGDLGGLPAHIVVDCMNTATVVAYQDVYTTARHLKTQLAKPQADVDWHEEVERLLASLYIPQLVRHMQIFHAAMQRAGTQAYIKVGTSGTGGMGLNIPYTHGEEKPSRVLMSKAAVAGAQTLLTFLMARTPDGPTVVKEIKPTAMIGWKQIGYGPIKRHGKPYILYDCPPDQAVSVDDPANLVREGDFGQKQDRVLEAVYINTGENGLFAAGEFAMITALGQMESVTAEEIAQNVVLEILGGNTGKDVIAALDGATMGPTYRAAYLRGSALKRLRQLEAQYGESVAFEILGPPRLSKLLFEAFLLKRAYGTIDKALEPTPAEAAATLEALVKEDADLRQKIISVGIPILLSDGKHLLRGPIIKAETANQGWVDLTPDNLALWQTRLQRLLDEIRLQTSGDTSSRYDRIYPAAREWAPHDLTIHIGELVGWLLNTEERGFRFKR